MHDVIKEETKFSEHDSFIKRNKGSSSAEHEVQWSVGACAAERGVQ